MYDYLECESTIINNNTTFVEQLQSSLLLHTECNNKMSAHSREGIFISNTRNLKIIINPDSAARFTATSHFK